MPSFDNKFVIRKSARQRVRARLESDRAAGRLRSEEDSGVSIREVLRILRVACARKVHGSEYFAKGGAASKPRATAYVQELSKALEGLASAIDRLSDLIGTDAYDEMPERVLLALHRRQQERDPFGYGYGAVEVFRPLDLLHWNEGRAGRLWGEQHWAHEMLSLVRETDFRLAEPGREAVSPERDFAEDVVALLQMIDRSDDQPVRKPTRALTVEWLNLAYDVLGTSPNASVENMAKTAIQRRFSPDSTVWRHPPRPNLRAPRLMYRRVWPSQDLPDDSEI